MINKSTIEEVMAQANIVEVVQDFLALKKKGTTHEAPCPFHGEKTASFKVSESKNIYKCFGCAASGGPVNFVMEHEKYSYPEAIKYLADKYKIIFVEEDVDDKQREIEMAKEDIFKINEVSADKFHQNLLASDKAWKYIIKREFTPKTVEKFQIGYAAAGYRELFDHLIEQKLSEHLVLKSGVSYKNDDAKIIDRFRNRIMFPIHSITGRIVGFGGRIFNDEKDTAKYVNTSDSDVYHKKNILYGLYFAKKAIIVAKEAYMTEGYADVISMHQGNIENTIASSGTSLTIEQVKQIKKWANKLTFLYDGDTAGIKAAARGVELAIQEGLSVRVVSFPKGEDPDSMIRLNGPEKLREFLENNKQDIIDFYLRDWNLKNPEEKDQLGRIIIRLIAKIPEDEIFRIKAYTEKMSKIFAADIRKVQARIVAERKGLVSADTLEDIAPTPNESNYEIEFVKILILYGKETYFLDKKCYYYMIEQTCKPSDFNHPLSKRLYQIYYEQLSLGCIPDIDFYIAHPEKEISDFASALHLNHLQISEAWKIKTSNLENIDFIKIVQNTTTFLRIFKKKELISHFSSQLSTTDDVIEEEKLFNRINKIRESLAEECRSIGINII